MHKEKSRKTNNSQDKNKLKENLQSKVHENELSITQRKDFINLQRKQKIR